LFLCISIFFRALPWAVAFDHFSGVHFFFLSVNKLSIGFYTFTDLAHVSAAQEFFGNSLLTRQVIRVIFCGCFVHDFMEITRQANTRSNRGP